MTDARPGSDTPRSNETLRGVPASAAPYDYQATLLRIAERVEKEPRTLRRLVYEFARLNLSREISRRTPPLVPTERTECLQALETAIARVESELSRDHLAGLTFPRLDPSGLADDSPQAPIADLRSSATAGNPAAPKPAVPPARPASNEAARVIAMVPTPRERPSFGAKPVIVSPAEPPVADTDPAQVNPVTRPAAMHENTSEEQTIARTAEKLVGNLQEFAEDIIASLKEHVPDLGAKLHATPWKKEMSSIVCTLSVTHGKQHDVRVAVQMANDEVTVNGARVQKGRSPIDAVRQEVLRILAPRANASAAEAASRRRPELVEHLQCGPETDR